MKVQSVAEKGCSASMVVDDGVGEDYEARSQSSPTLVVGGGAEVESGTVIMMEAAPLNIVRVLSRPITRNKVSRSDGKRECQNLQTVS